MQIRGDYGCNGVVELTLRERITEPPQSRGDVAIEVAVASEHFAGQDSVWISLDESRRSMAELEAFERTREGSATLRSMSPNRFALTFSPVGKRGRLAVAVRIEKWVFAGEQSPHRHLVEVEFEIDPGMLRRILSGLSQLLLPSGDNEAFGN
jgi:hypothetical protein